MRHIAANYIFPVNRPPIKNGIITLNDSNQIVSVSDNEGLLTEKSALEFYNGAIVPGFVNCHSHLELSHLRGKIPQKLGMQGFIQAVRSLREDTFAIEKKIHVADKEMEKEGIVLVGDIVNQEHSFIQKKKSAIRYLSFIEVFGLNPSENAKKIKATLTLYQKFVNQAFPVTLTMHALYSLNNTLAEKIIYENKASAMPLSIHHLESREEHQYIENGTGKLKILMEQINQGEPPENTLLLNYTFLNWISANKNLLLVHNTRLKERRLKQILSKHQKTWWVLCPNSNLYIHDELPPVNLLFKNTPNIAIGTDSLASNQRLSILAEIMTLQRAFPTLDFSTLLSWATLNGARALNHETAFGSLESGKRPGLNLLTPFDFRQMTITADTRVKKLA